ncbi:MAG: aminotransferase class I/II-fold pyridoxal phosphate-dependent enzyme [Spirochaetaceae bacterium]|nr:aminotransferase class I/II-fold pyridoxal phosphate-dependent enzyme [Spirochaetaceae bacterium]
MESIDQLMKKYEDFKAMGLALNMQRGQPSDENFDLSNPMISILKEGDYSSDNAVDLRNYPGGPAGLKECRQLFAEIMDVDWEEVLVGNNASLKMLSNLLMWTMIKGVKDSSGPWKAGDHKIIVATPGYDRHFTLLEKLGFTMEVVDITAQGPNMDKVEELVAGDASIKGILFVPTYSNPTGDCLSPEYAQRLASMKTAAPDFTIFADDAYAVHHLTDNPPVRPNLIRLCEKVGNPQRAYVFASTSKVTFSGGGIGAMATSTENMQWYLGLLGTQSIGPNKFNQYRHVKFLKNFPGGYKGLMKAHAKIIAPKFQAVHEILEKELGGTGLATWTDPHGGYFLSLDTSKPIAAKVVTLAAEAGVSLTPAGATYPSTVKHGDHNIRLAPTRPPLNEVITAMEVVALCIKIAAQA